MVSVGISRLNLSFSYFCAFLPWAVLPFSAPLAFYVGLLVLLVLSFFYPSQSVRVILAVCIIIGGAVGFGDSQFTSDMENYHDTYTKLFNGDFEAIFDYGRGVEVIMPLFWVVLSFFDGFLNYTAFGVLHALCAGILFYIWLEKYALEGFDTKKAAVCVFFSLLMFDYWMPQWLLRQTFSCIFVLYALSQNTRFKTFVFLLIAVFCHVSAILFFALWYWLRKYPKFGAMCIVFLCFMMLANFLFPWLYAYASMLPESFSHKLVFYQYSLNNTISDGFSASLYVYIIAIVFCAWYFRDSVDRKWLWIIIWYGILCLCANAVWNHFFIRVSILYFYISLGFFMFVSMQKNTFLLYIWGSLLFINHIRTAYAKGVANLSNIQYHFHSYGLGGEWFYFILN